MGNAKQGKGREGRTHHPKSRAFQLHGYVVLPTRKDGGRDEAESRHTQANLNKLELPDVALLGGLWIAHQAEGALKEAHTAAILVDHPADLDPCQSVVLNHTLDGAHVGVEHAARPAGQLPEEP